jgi:hypothetical protein
MPNDDKVRRIAMWSGPRNISTALMRSWSNRADTAVVDEPFYAYYLQKTGRKHPGASEVTASGISDWRVVVSRLTEANRSRPEASIFYQKHMTHHLLPEVDREWLGSLTNCFLIRDPREVIVSYMKRNGEPVDEDIGFVQQAAIFDWVCEKTGSTPPVIDARDVLQNPERTLRRLCEAVEVEFDSAMLSWPPGLRETDGVWAKYWYGEVARSTSFQPYRPRNEPVPERLRGVCERAQQCYERLYRYRLD